MASHEVYNKDNKYLSKLKFKSKTLNILRNIIISLVIILGLNWVIAITTDVNLLGTGLRKFFDAVEGYNHPIPSVEIVSDDWSSQTPGSWHINKSAKWTGANTAEVVFDLNTTKKYISEGLKFDVVMVLDVSTSMYGEKIEKLQESAKKYFDEILSDNDNRIAIVEFSTDATILQTFTNNKERLNNTADNLKLKCSEPNGWCTNYYAGLKKAEEVLTNYKPQEMRQLVILFLTDGGANNQNQLISVEYQTLKEKYPDSIINGIQYEMGSSINYYLRQASDEQYDATTENIYNKFFNATYVQKLVRYENFEIVDYIKDKYFKVNSASDISVDIGSVKLENESNGTQKIIWTLNPDFKSGMKAQMKINLTLKDAYVKDVDKDFYPTNNGEDITWQIPDESKKTKKSTLTPVLQRIYNVIYDNNPPSDCNISKTDIEKHYGYENVKIKDTHPTCAGYNFKGWEIVTDDIKQPTENTFVMPEGNVTIRGKWGAQSISKSMKGQLYEKPTLYTMIQLDARNGNTASIYEGEVTDEFNKTINAHEQDGVSDGIYYYTEADYNNVIFAGFCWQIIRTTTTGGVKLLYNGTPISGQCNNTGATQALPNTSPYNVPSTSPAYVGYMYNTVYNYDEGNVSSSTLVGEDVTWNGTQYQLTKTQKGTIDANHHYTCNNTTGICTSIRYYFYIDSSDKIYNYITLTNGKKISDALDEMLGTNNYDDTINNTINTKSSNMKSTLDNWYASNLNSKHDSNGNSYASYLEDIVYCNDRVITEYGGWLPNNNLIYGDMEFYNVGYGSVNTSLACPRLIDQFSQANPKAKLTYPIGLLTYEETQNVGESFLFIGEKWSTMTPLDFEGAGYNATVFIINRPSTFTVGNVDLERYVRPVISLKPGIKPSSGSGFKDDPYVVDKLN